MCIVGEDDLSSASMENADLVVCFHLSVYFPSSVWQLKVQLTASNFVLVCQIEEGLRAAGKTHLFTRLSYPGAGHLIEPPYSPHRRTSMWSIKPRKRELRAAGLSHISHFLSLWGFFLTGIFFFMERDNNHDFSCSGHTVGRSSCTSCCRPGGFLEEDAGFYGASSETMSRKHRLLEVLHISWMSSTRWKTEVFFISIYDLYVLVLNCTFYKPKYIHPRVQNKSFNWPFSWMLI